MSRDASSDRCSSVGTRRGAGLAVCGRRAGLTPRNSVVAPLLVRDSVAIEGVGCGVPASATLTLLAWSGESSGYELHKRAARSVGFIWAPARSQLYAVLKRLEQAELVTGRHVVQADRPDKRLFSISQAGMAVLREWLDRVEDIEPEDRDGILLKLFFGAFGDPAAGRRQLDDYRRRVEQRLATYREIERTFDDETGAAALLRLQTLRLGIALMEATLTWTDGTLEALPTPTGSARG